MNTKLTRRKFITASSATILCVPALNAETQGVAACYYDILGGKTIQCRLCPRQCVIQNGKRGHCDARENQNGTLISVVYGKIAAHHNDPIEKKPFNHVLPGTNAFSIATAGCNVDCKFCQNWELAQRTPEEVYVVSMTPEEVAGYAQRAGSKAVAYTYNEPIIFTEFLIDIAQATREKGLKNVVISNGYIQNKPLLDICSVVDAYKVDLKSFREKYYQDIVGAHLKPVLETLVTLRAQNVWTEIVYLMVPTLNDSASEIKDLAKWMMNELGPDVPVHFSRFYPKYKLKNLPPTPVSSLERAYNICRDAGLKYVYLGNIPGHSGENTICPNCHEIVLGRVGYKIFKNNLRDGKCGQCSKTIPGIWR